MAPVSGSACPCSSWTRPTKCSTGDSHRTSNASSAHAPATVRQRCSRRRCQRGSRVSPLATFTTPVTIEVDADTPGPPEIEHVVYDVEAAASWACCETCSIAAAKSAVIVFGRTKHGVKKLAQRLEELGYPAAALQGNLSQNARERVMAGFRSGAVPILLATNVAARGLDVPEVGQVINYELPESAEWFTHRAARTGRMGRAGRAITLLTPDDAAAWRGFERSSATARTSNRGATPRTPRRSHHPHIR